MDQAYLIDMGQYIGVWIFSLRTFSIVIGPKYRILVRLYYNSEITRKLLSNCCLKVRCWGLTHKIPKIANHDLVCINTQIVHCIYPVKFPFSIIGNKDTAVSATILKGVWGLQLLVHSVTSRSEQALRSFKAKHYHSWNLPKLQGGAILQYIRIEFLMAIIDKLAPWPVCALI